MPRRESPQKNDGSSELRLQGGGVKLGDVATLLGDVNNQKAAGGILLTLEKPTKPMRDEAVDAGRYESRASGTTRIIRTWVFN